jgi:hypothetical protein
MPAFSPLFPHSGIQCEKCGLINYTPEMEMARSRGDLLSNSFVRLRKPFVGRSAIDVDDLGDAEGLLRNPRFLGTAARQLLMRGSCRPRTGGEVGSDEIRQLSERLPAK